MSRVPPMASPAPPPPEADKARMVIDYQGRNSGMQILDAREHIRVALTGEPPKGLRWALKDAGFKVMPGNDRMFIRTKNPDAIFNAHVIGREVCPAPKE